MRRGLYRYGRRDRGRDRNGRRNRSLLLGLRLWGGSFSLAGRGRSRCGRWRHRLLLLLRLWRLGLRNRHRLLLLDGAARVVWLLRVRRIVEVFIAPREVLLLLVCMCVTAAC